MTTVSSFIIKHAEGKENDLPVILTLDVIYAIKSLSLSTKCLLSTFICNINERRKLLYLFTQCDKSY